MEKEICITQDDCEEFCAKILKMTQKDELVWVSINTLIENYNLGGLFNEHINGVKKFKTDFNKTKIVLSTAYYNSEKRYNLEFFPNDDVSFYRMPNISERLVAMRLKELEEAILKQIERHNIETIAKIMGNQ